MVKLRFQSHCGTITKKKEQKGSKKALKKGSIKKCVKSRVFGD